MFAIIILFHSSCVTRFIVWGNVTGEDFLREFGETSRSSGSVPVELQLLKDFVPQKLKQFVNSMLKFSR